MDKGEYFMSPESPMSVSVTQLVLYGLGSPMSVLVTLHCHCTALWFVKCCIGFWHMWPINSAVGRMNGNLLTYYTQTRVRPIGIFSVSADTDNLQNIYCRISAFCR